MSTRYNIGNEVNENTWLNFDEWCFHKEFYKDLKNRFRLIEVFLDDSWCYDFTNNGTQEVSLKKYSDYTARPIYQNK